MRSSISIRRVAALAAVLVMGALATASAASALPEFHSATWPDKFTGGSEHVTFEGPWGTVTCKASVTGTIKEAGIEAKSVIIKFSSGCYWLCETTELAFETDKLEPTIGYISAAEKRVGMLLVTYKAGAEKGGGFAKCGLTRHVAGPVEIVGGVIGQLEPVNTSTTELSLKFRGNNLGEQELKHFEGEEMLHNLEMTEEVKKIAISGEAIHLKLEHAIEIKA